MLQQVSYKTDAFPVTQLTATKHQKKLWNVKYIFNFSSTKVNKLYTMKPSLTHRWLHFPASRRHVSRTVNFVDSADHQHMASAVLVACLSHCNHISQSTLIHTKYGIPENQTADNKKRYIFASQATDAWVIMRYGFFAMPWKCRIYRQTGDILCNLWSQTT